MSKAKFVTRRVYDFHRDNFKDILTALLTNYVYAMFMVGVPVFIFIGDLRFIVLALLGAYIMLTVVINRPRYATLYGKALMVISCTAGGTTSYLLGEIIKKILL